MNPSRNLAAAEFYSSVGRAEQALQEVEDHLANSPLDQAGLLLRSALLMEVGRLDEAEAAARQALAGDPQSAVALATLARIARLQSKWLPAEDWARQSLAVQENWLALNELGLALQGQGQVQEALQCFDATVWSCTEMSGPSTCGATSCWKWTWTRRNSLFSHCWKSTPAGSA